MYIDWSQHNAQEDLHFCFDLSTHLLQINYSFLIRFFIIFTFFPDPSSPASRISSSTHVPSRRTYSSEYCHSPASRTSPDNSNLRARSYRLSDQEIPTTLLAASVGTKYGVVPGEEQRKERADSKIEIKIQYSRQVASPGAGGEIFSTLICVTFSSFRSFTDSDGFIIFSISTWYSWRQRKPSSHRHERFDFPKGDWPYYPNSGPVWSHTSFSQKVTAIVILRLLPDYFDS